MNHEGIDFIEWDDGDVGRLKKTKEVRFIKWDKSTFIGRLRKHRYDLTEYINE